MSAQSHESTPSEHNQDIATWQLEGGDLKTNLANLLQLYTNGDQDGFIEKLDDVTYESLSEDRAFMNNIRRIHTTTTPKQEQDSIRDAQRRMFEQRKQAILTELGIKSEDEEADFSEKRAVIQNMLAEVDVSGNESAEDILKILGIISSNEAGQEVFTYPPNLFPSTTNDKWDSYLGSVKSHLQKSREFGSGMLGKEDIELADRTRRVAHNAVSRDIDKLLGLDLLPESTWDFEKTRKLVVKMREHRFPTVDTAEEHVTTRAVAFGLAAAAALAAKHEG